MRYYFLFMILLLNFFSLTAHTTVGIIGNIGNVYYNGDAQGESQYQNQAIAYLCNEYIKKYYPILNENVFLELRIDEPIYFKLSYDKYQGDQWQFAEQNRPVKGQGIRIRLHNKFNRAESTLKLLEYSLNNLRDLKKSSEEFYSNDNHYGSNYLSIDTTILDEILHKPMSHKIEFILHKKVYRNLGETEYNIYKEYYVQNDTFHLIDFMNNDEEYLELDQLYQLITEYYLGTIIFDTDSTGYFYNREERKLSNKFIIKDKIESYYYTHTSSDNIKKRVYFEYQTYFGKKKKFIYLADKYTLIQKVEKLEDEFINKEIENASKAKKDYTQ